MTSWGAFESVIPVGVITMWSGSVDTIPDGWALCNGENGTPDLRNRFIVGAGDSYSVGNTGGVESVIMYDTLRTGGSIMSRFYSIPEKAGENTYTWDNRPPYYALCYIMKI